MVCKDHLVHHHREFHDFREAQPDLADNDRCIFLNLNAPIHLITRMMAGLKSRPEAMIVNVTSGLALAPRSGGPVYCASKAGLIAYLQSLRAELRPTPLTVHTISPGYLRTALTAGNTFAMPGLLEPDAAARALLQGVAQGREHIVLPRRIGWLSKALSLLPAKLHDRILLGQPRKPRAGQVGATPIPGLNHPSHKP